jgi:hypothetical protein
MSWLLFYLLAALHPVAFILIGVLSKTWKQRLLLWALLPLPALWYCKDYYVIKHEHEQMCAAEGGLRVLIQPEKADRVRLVGEGYRMLSAQALLEKYYPKLALVESKSGEWNSQGKKITDYFAYAVEPNPKVGLPMDKDPWKEPKLIFSESKLDSLDPNMYEISEHEFNTPRSSRKETRLSRNGKVYAKYTELVHWWSGIQYPDALPTWRCPAQKKSPPKDDPNAPIDKWNYPPSPKNALTELILK